MTIVVHLSSPRSTLLPTTGNQTSPYRDSHIPFTSFPYTYPPATWHSQSFFTPMSSHQSQPLIDQPLTPHPIAHRGTANTALINRFTTPDLPITHLHTTTTALVYMRHQTQRLYHKHTVCLWPPSPNCDLMKHYLNDEILNHTLQILHQESPHRATRHVLPMFFMNMIT